MNDIETNLKTQCHSWLITGVAGFIGSNLLQTLLANGQTVIGLDNFSTGNKTNIEDALKELPDELRLNFTFIEGDICDPEICKAACRQSEIVLHQAALGSVPRSIKDPIATNETNITGFLNMLVAAKEQGVKRFVYAASSSTYGDHQDLPKKEDRIGNPLSPYAVTKYVNELYAKVFADIYGIETVGLRYFNVFGQRQDPNGDYAAVIPRWIQSILQGDAVNIYGDGQTSRDFCFVGNAVQANLCAALTKKTEAINQVYNIAVGEKTTLNELYQLILNEIKIHKMITPKNPIYQDFRGGDVRHSLADISKAKKLLDYCPAHTIRSGLRVSIPWYIAHFEQAIANQTREPLIP